MSKNVLRNDKTCLNCRHVVEQRYCPNCGQENSESRKTFHHLFVHFFEDLTHYENAFWRTIKNLIFKPASLTKEYLSGKRLSYLAPVRLYIFISFITFFLLTVIPDTNNTVVNRNTTTHILITKKAPELKTLLKSESMALQDSNAKEIKKSKNKPGATDFLNFGVTTEEQLDSIQKFGKPDDRYSALEYWAIKKMLGVKNHHTKTEIIEKFKEGFEHHLSKTLFIYMPIFAFFLWLFHSKKRWYYFDHGIFTLHYFSFLLLVVLVTFLFSQFLALFGKSTLADIINGAFDLVALAWMFYYFFPAHHRFYGETRIVSFLKSGVLFFINIVLIIIIIALFAFYTFINLH